MDEDEMKERGIIINTSSLCSSRCMMVLFPDVVQIGEDPM